MRFAGLAGLLLLAACDGGGDPVEQALREASAANHAATVRETAATSMSAAPAPDPEPAAAADQAYVAEMIAHHRRAIASAEAVVETSRDPELRRMALEAIDARTREIAEMQAWRPTAQSADR